MALKRIKDSLEGFIALVCATTVFVLAIADAPVQTAAGAGTIVQTTPAGR